MNNCITAGNARFTRLAPGLVRMEYSPSKTFEDRRSVRALTRPEGSAFTEVSTATTPVRLSTGRLVIEYRPDGKPFHAGNLRAMDAATGQAFWNPSSVDETNLGGVHVSMDCVKPGMIPEGVHPATVEHHHIGIEQTLWTFYGRLHSEDGPTVGDGANLPGLFDEVLATQNFDTLPASLKALMRERWKFPPALLSRAGYFLYNDTPTPLIDPASQWVVERPEEEGAMDLYLFYYGLDFKQALRDFRLLFGPTPLMPRYSLGLWYSRYPTFSEEEVYQLVKTFEQHDLPLDMFVFDLEWHKRGWNGFDWDTDHIPTPDRLLGFLRDRNIHTTFNVHPNSVPIDDSRFGAFLEAAGITCDTEAIRPDYRGVKTFNNFDASIPRHAEAFMDVLHKPVQDQGVDFWWIDGDCPTKSIKGLDAQLWTNHIYHEHIKKTYPERRPMIFSRTPGFGAHRYPFHFTADTWSYWATLENQVEQTLRAGHMGQSYITHDIGGHISSALHIDPELYMRWVQFAVLSPVIRLHSSKQGEGVGGERRPWLYGELVLKSFHTALQLRMTLIPYLYTLVRESNREGLPICRSNCLERPAWEEGYKEWDSYFIGDRLYAAPVVKSGTVRTVRLPEGIWYHGLTGERIKADGKAVRTEVSPFGKAPLHYYRGGSLMIKQPFAHRASALPETLLIELYAQGSDCRDTFTLYEDDGVSQDCDRGAFTEQTFTMVEEAGAVTLTIAARTGCFEGAPVARRYQVKLIGGRAMQVKLNGTLLAGEEGEVFNTPPLRTDEVQEFCLFDS